LNRTARTPIAIVAATLALLALAVAAPASQAAKARVIVDRAAAEKVGRAGITPDVRPSSNLTLNLKGQVVAKFEVKGTTGNKIKLGGAFLFSRGSTKVRIGSLRVVDGKRIVGKVGGRSFTALKLRGVGRGDEAIRFKSGVLSKEMAGLLRNSFDEKLFEKGMRFFRKGTIPRP